MYVGLAGFGIDDGPATLCSVSTSIAASVIVCGVRGACASCVTMAVDVDVVVVVDDNDERSVQASVCGAPHALFTAPAPGSRVPAGAVWRAEWVRAECGPSADGERLANVVAVRKRRAGLARQLIALGHTHTHPTHDRQGPFTYRILSIPFIIRQPIRF